MEARQFSLVAQRAGADPTAFDVSKFTTGPSGYKVRVVGRGAATVYEAEDSHSWIGQFARDADAGLFGNNEGDVALPQEVAEGLEQVRKALARGGLPAALATLNKRVPHRFTAVYRLVGQALHNVATADKHLHLDPLDLAVVPLNDSFCQFVLRDSVFLTRDSGSDLRLAGHPYSGVVGCYAGVPVHDVRGRLAGTLCHFDLEGHDVADHEFLLLARAARLMPAFLGQ